MDLDAAEVRVLGCLIEKQRTTPDVYPLSLNGLRAACNQSTNRDPVVAYDDDTHPRRAAPARPPRLDAAGAGARAAKYRHLLDEKPGLARDEQAVLAVLMLRGPQTLNELRTRTERMQPFADTAELESVLGRLAERGFAELQPRRPGQKEQRYAHLLSSDLEDEDGGSRPRRRLRRGHHRRSRRRRRRRPRTRWPSASTGSRPTSPRSRTRSPSCAPRWASSRLRPPGGGTYGAASTVPCARRRSGRPASSGVSRLLRR